MAYEIPGLSVSLNADADMAANQYKLVKMSASDNTFSLCDTDGEVTLGILQDKPASGEGGAIMLNGVSKVKAAETLVAGDHYGTNSAGLATKVEVTNTGADVGDYSAGIVLQGGLVNELITVTLGVNTFKVESV